MMLQIDSDTILQLQKDDRDCREIDQLLRNDVFQAQNLSEIVKHQIAIFAKRCTKIDNVLVAWSNSADELYVPVIPRALRAFIIEQAHVGMKGHL